MCVWEWEGKWVEYTLTCGKDGVHVLNELKEIEEYEKHEWSSHGETNGMVTRQLMNTYMNKHLCTRE